MKFYITNENQEIVKRHYLKKIEREYEIINLKFEIASLACFNFQENKYERYILNQKIKKKIEKCNKNKKINSVIYIIEKLDYDFINNLKEYFELNEIFFNEFILIDYSSKIHRNLYQYFDNVV